MFPGWGSWSSYGRYRRRKATSHVSARLPAIATALIAVSERIASGRTIERPCRIKTAGPQARTLRRIKKETNMEGFGSVIWLIIIGIGAFFYLMMRRGGCGGGGHNHGGGKEHSHGESSGHDHSGGAGASTGEEDKKGEKAGHKHGGGC